MSGVHEVSKVNKGGKGLKRLIARTCYMIWSKTAPYVTSTTTFSDPNNSNNTYSMITGVAFNESCPKLETTPPIGYALGHNISLSALGDLTKVDQTSEVVASSEGVQLSGNISVNYDTGCVYYDTDSMLSMSSYSYPLEGIVIISWRPQVSPVFKSSRFLRSSTPSWYPDVQNTLIIGPKDCDTDHRLEIVTQISNLISSDWNITVTINSNLANPNGPSTGPFYTLNSSTLSTPLITMAPGDTYPGLNSKIKVDYTQGCIYFDNDDDQDPVLFKPTNETSKYAKDFQIRFVKIFDWLGLAIPGTK